MPMTDIPELPPLFMGTKIVSMPKWKGFTEWRSSADPDKSLSAKEAMEKYDWWFRGWSSEVAAKEIVRQTGRNPFGICEEAEQIDFP
jgi:hypothetical protein